MRGFIGIFLRGEILKDIVAGFKTHLQQAQACLRKCVYLISDWECKRKERVGSSRLENSLFNKELG